MCVCVCVCVRERELHVNNIHAQSSVDVYTQRTCSVSVKFGKKFYQFVFILEQDVLRGFCLVGISHKHL